MFKIIKVELNNWSYFSPFTCINFHNNLNLLLGENGSGKTSLINAIRFALGGSSYSSNSKSDNIHFKNYLVNGESAIIKLLVTNFTKDGRCVFSFFDKSWDSSAEISLFCLVYKNKTREYYIGLGDIPIHGFKDNIKQYRTEGIISSRLNIDTYRNDILAKVGLTTSYLDAISQEQGKVPDYVHMNDEQLYHAITDVIDISTILDKYQKERLSYLETRQNEERILQQLKERLWEKQKLEERVENYREYFANLDKYNDLKDYFIPILREKDIVNEIKSIKKKLVDIENNIFNWKKELEDNESQIKITQEQLNVLNVDMNKFSEEFQNINKQIQLLNEQKSNTERDLRDYKQFQTNLNKAGLKYDNISELTNEVIVNHLENLEKNESNLRNDLHSTKNRLHLATQEIEKLSNFVYKGSNLPFKVKEMYNLVSKELREQGIDYIMLADGINIIDQSWQRAVEGILGSQRFSIVVKEDDLLKAKHIGNKYHYKYKIMKEKISNYNINPNSLLAKVHAHKMNLDISGHIYFMNKFNCVESIDEGHQLAKKKISSITKDCYEQDGEGSGISKYISEHSFCCGLKDNNEIDKNIENKINQLKSKIDEYKKHIDDVDKEIYKLEDVIRLIKKTKNKKIDFQDINKYNDILIALNNDIEKLQNESRNMIDNYSNLHVQIEKHSNKISDLYTTKKTLQQNISNSENDVEMINNNITELKLEQGAIKKAIALMDPGKQWEISTSIETNSYSIDHYIKESERYLTLVDEYVKKHKTSAEDAERYPINSAIVTHYKSKIDEIEHLFEIQKAASLLTQKRMEAYDAARQSFNYAFDKIINQINSKLKEFSENINIKFHVRKVIKDETKFGIEYDIGFADKPITSFQDRKLSGGEATVANILFFLAITNFDQKFKPDILILDEHTSNLDNKNMCLIENFFLSTEMQCLFSTPKASEARIFEHIQNYIFLTPNRKEKFWPYPAYLTRESLVEIINQKDKEINKSIKHRNN